MTTMHWNSRIGLDELGKPNSAYIARHDRSLCIDHLVESPQFVRAGRPKLHEQILDVVDYSKDTTQLFDGTRVISGHIAPLTISTEHAAYIFTLDCVHGKKPCIPSEAFGGIIQALYGARIIPLTSDGHIIQP